MTMKIGVVNLGNWPDDVLKIEIEKQGLFGRKEVVNLLRGESCEVGVYDKVSFLAFSLNSPDSGHLGHPTLLTMDGKEATKISAEKVGYITSGGMEIPCLRDKEYSEIEIKQLAYGSGYMDGVWDTQGVNIKEGTAYRRMKEGETVKTDVDFRIQVNIFKVPPNPPEPETPHGFKLSDTKSKGE